MTETIHIEPHVLMRRDEDTEVMGYIASENALIVFRNEEDAEKFRATTGQFPEAEGYEAVYMDAKDLAKACIRHDFRQVCMPEPWTGTKESGADFFKAHAFIEMLVESVAVEE